MQQKHKKVSGIFCVISNDILLYVNSDDTTPLCVNKNESQTVNCFVTTSIQHIRHFSIDYLTLADIDGDITEDRKVIQPRTLRWYCDINDLAAFD